MTNRGDPDELGSAAGSDGLGRVITTTPDLLLRRGKRVLADAPRACATTCLQLAKADAVSAARPLVSYLPIDPV
jgi:hypothetical protein